MEQCWGNRQLSAKPAPNWLMKGKSGLPQETISIAMGIDRKLCCELWVMCHRYSASELPAVRCKCRGSWPRLPPAAGGGCVRLAQDCSPTDEPPWQGMEQAVSIIKPGGCKHGAVLWDGDQLPPLTLASLRQKQMPYCVVFSLPFAFLLGKKKDHTSAYVLIAITSKGLTFFYFLYNRITQETSKQNFLPFRKSSADAVGNRITLAITKTTFFISDA